MQEAVPQSHKVSRLMLVVAFATVYIVWGSTYYFIQVAVQDFPPMIMGALRFVAAGGLLMGWCYYRGEVSLTWQQIRPAVITGLLLLLIGNGAVMTAEKWLPSSLVAILISSAPFWFVILDFRDWNKNLKSRSVIFGLIFGFVGVSLMFSEKVMEAITSAGFGNEILGLLILLAGTISWSAGSLYSKYHSSGSTTANSAWQMLAAGAAFVTGSLITGEWSTFSWGTVSPGSWFSIVYLILLGSLAAYSAYVWLLRVRPAAQVSTYAYVNPVIAVLLGVFLAGEHMTLLQILGLVVILVSVLLINLSKYKVS